MTTQITLELLGVPPTFVDDIGGITLSSYWPIIKMALDVSSGPVVEIGADKGFCTAKLASACAETGRAFHSIDPSPSNGVDEIEGVIHHRITSFDFFAKNSFGASLWIVDGDHNYVTVRGELDSIAARTDSDETVILLHDVGWPCGRRDFWYNLAEAPELAARTADGRSVSIDASGDVPAGEGIFLGNVSAVALVEGGPRNGVMTAIEDFLASPAGIEWEMRWTPLLFGLAILTKKGVLASERMRPLRMAFDAFDQNREIIASAELNRLRLLLTLNQKWAALAVSDTRGYELAERLERAEAVLRTPFGRLARFTYRIVKKVLGK
jgi:hypothetical protein